MGVRNEDERLVGPFRLITTGTLTGPWHVAPLDDGKGKRLSRMAGGGRTGRGRTGSWYIVNADTGKSKRIGPISLKGKNWHDEAMDIARERNQKHLRSLDPETLPTLLGKNDLLDQAISKILKEMPT